MRVNSKLFEDIAPGAYVDPISTEYDLIVIGGGESAMFTAAGARIVNAKVAMI